MHSFINSSWTIGNLTLPHRLIQGPLAGYSCAPFRTLFNHYRTPAYCVSEMISARDILDKHKPQSRYLARDPNEVLLAYQLSGTEKDVLAKAAAYLQNLGADLIDINCGCPKTKIRKKGAGSALLEQPQRLTAIVREVRQVLTIPLTVKIRIQGTAADLVLAQQIEEAGADALIVHGRRWTDDYDVACNVQQIAQIKQAVTIPVIANGDMGQWHDVQHTISETGCDGFMIARAGCGRPWLYQELLTQEVVSVSFAKKWQLFLAHLEGLARLEDEHKALLQSKSLIRYYFRNELSNEQLTQFYQLKSLTLVNEFSAQLML